MSLGQCSHCGSLYHDSEDCDIHASYTGQTEEIKRLKKLCRKAADPVEEYGQELKGSWVPEAMIWGKKYIALAKELREAGRE